MNVLLQFITQAAVDATAATQGWLLTADGDKLQVVAAAGQEPGALVGVQVPASEGSAGYVIASAQPLALSGADSDPRTIGGVASLLSRRPSSILCVPCGSDDIVLGALELVDKDGEPSFSFSDLETATLLGSIAGMALQETLATGTVPPSPAEISHGMAQLQSVDPARYAAVASMVGALLTTQA